MTSYKDIKQKADKENENNLIKTYKSLIKYIDKEIERKSIIGLSLIHI